MTWGLFLEIFLDSLKDSALVFAFVFLFHIILAFFEDKMASLLVKKRYRGPLFGSLFGIIPQCGTSVLAADLYAKKYITLGTIVAVFLSCSDEALILLLTNPSQKTLLVIPLVLIKFFIGVGVGLLIDVIFKKQEIKEPEVEHELEDVICEEHHHKDVKLHKYLLHPLVHALEIFAYVLVINILLGLLIGFVGEDNFKNFVISNRYISPLLASVVGLIPNCASSVFLSELFLGDSLSFGALTAGLLVNSGLGVMMLLKNRKTIKNAGIILGICFVTAIIIGYIICAIKGF